MPELWTCSGINSPADGRGGYIDYVGRKLGHDPKHVLSMRDLSRRYASRLGSSRRYPRQRNVLRLDPKRLLDREAEAFAKGEIQADLGVEKGALIDRDVRLLLVAPKTGVKPPRVNMPIEVYWGAYDPVPNQGIFRPDTLKHWRKLIGKDRVYPIGAKHGFSNYCPTWLRLVKRGLIPRTNRRPGQPRKKYAWIQTDEYVVGVQERLRELWLDPDLSRDALIIVAHSQGTNIAMHLLRRGYARP